MKKLLYLFFLLVHITMFSQKEYQGKAIYIYKEIVDIDNLAKTNKVSKQEAKQLVENMKHLLEKKYILSFNKTSSIYKQEVALAKPSIGKGQGGFAGNNPDVLYKNIQEKKSFEGTEIMGKRFLVYEDLEKPNWELTNETRQIGNYTVYKATMLKKSNITESEKILVTAWYTLQFPVSHGPAEYWGLPGLILEINYGNYQFLCSEIVLNPSKEIKIEKPSRGEKIEREDYIKLKRKKWLEYLESRKKTSKN